MNIITFAVGHEVVTATDALIELFSRRAPRPGEDDEQVPDQGWSVAFWDDRVDNLAISRDDGSQPAGFTHAIQRLRDAADVALELAGLTPLEGYRLYPRRSLADRLATFNEPPPDSWPGDLPECSGRGEG